MTGPGTDRSRPARLLLGAAGLAGGLLAFVATFLPWLSTDTEDGGETVLTGWGGITGSSSIAGTNLNDVLNGDGTYRPGLIGLVFGAIAAVAGLVVVVYRPEGRRPHRITASVLALCGLVCLGFGLWRGIDPGDASVFAAGETAPGLGPWLTVLAGVLMLGSAAGIFAGAIDPPVRDRTRRGIQPR